jgi:hypothetical protein
MSPLAGWSRGTPGKMRAKKGAMIRASASMAPAFSPSARIPIHSVMTPASGSAMSITANRAETNVPSTMRWKTSVSPRKIHCANAAAKPTMKKPAQM